MIDNTIFNFNIDEDAIEYFNNSIVSSNNPNYIFKPEIADMLLDYKTVDKFYTYNYDLAITLNMAIKTFFSTGINISINIDLMKKMIYAIEKYLEFYGTADKKIQIQKRINDLEKDFV